MKNAAEPMHGYTYGTPAAAPSPVSLRELEDLKTSAGFTEDDARALHLAGEVLADQAAAIVDHWRVRIIGGIPHLARHTRTPEGAPIPAYSAQSGQRFVRWILDTCLRPYDQDWLDYQHEIALRHTSVKKNKTDGVRSTPHVPLRDILAFIPVMNETIKPYLAARGHSAAEVEQMHRAWCKSLQIQMALWTRAYMSAGPTVNEW